MKKIKSLTIKNFRCFNNLSLNFSENIILIKGPNGCGKTTILESLNYASTMQSFRTSHITELINFKDKIRIIFIFFFSFAIKVNFYVNLYLFSLANFKDISNYYEYIYYSLISIANCIPFFFSGFGIREFFSVIFSEYLNLDPIIYLNFTISIGLLNVLIALMYLLLRYIISFFNTSFFYNTRKY